jgi:hypothetical protein
MELELYIIGIIFGIIGIVYLYKKYADTYKNPFDR